jgi:hypothetical protein
MRSVAWLLLVSAALAATPASAADRFFSFWIVEPSQITSDTMLLHEKDFVQKTRLLPFGLAEVESDALVGSSGVPAIRAGEQLFELAGGRGGLPRPTTATVFCQVNAGEWQGGGLYGLLGAHRFQLRHCLVDNEKDGFFDNAFVTRNCFADFPIIQTKIPKAKNMATLNRLAYRRLPVGEVREGPTVGIVYTGNALLDGDPRFVQSFGSGNFIPLFGQKHSRAGDSPGQRTSFGAAFTIVSVEEDAVRLRNDRPMPAQPFSMFSSGTC